MSRRPVLSAAAAAPLVAAATAAALALAAPGGAPRSVEYPTRTMGTYARVVLVTADSAAGVPLARAAHATFARVDSLMSNWTTTSEVARLNRLSAKTPTAVQPEVARVLAAALGVHSQSRGAFDITVEPLVRAWGFIGGKPHVPPDSTLRAAAALVGGQYVRLDPRTGRFATQKEGVKVDLGGIAKGYAVDAVADTLRAHGVVDGLVDISGNMFALGAPPGAKAWRIGIRDPRDRRPYFARLSLTGEAISTSGQYEQFVAVDGRTYGHIMDPRTGRPAEGLIGVTVLAPGAMTADAWSTALFVLGGREARRMAAGRSDLSAILIAPGSAGVDTVWVEETLRDRFTLEPGADVNFKVEYYE